MLLKEEQKSHLVVPKIVAFCIHTLVQGPFSLAVATEIAPTQCLMSIEKGSYMKASQHGPSQNRS